MNPKIYKSRKVSFRESQINFEESYRYSSPSSWSDQEIKQVAHLIKWSSVSFNKREPVRLSKTLLIKELGQRGYLKHIHSVFPLSQGHNLIPGQISKYDYRMTLKTLVKWLNEQGYEAIEEFKILLNSVLSDIEKTFKKRMRWFWMMVSSWFGNFVDLMKNLLKNKKSSASTSNVTTIQESLDYSNPVFEQYCVKGEIFLMTGETEARSSKKSRVSQDFLKTYVH